MKRRGSHVNASCLPCSQPLKAGRASVETGSNSFTRLTVHFMYVLSAVSLFVTEYPSDTEAGLTYLKQLFPIEKYDSSLPAIILKHQVYSVIYDKTTVDSEIVSYNV